MIKKNLNCLPNSSILLHFSWCRKGHTYLKFHKLIIHNVTRTESFMPLLMITVTTFFSKVPHACSLRTDSPAISLIFCTINAALTLIFDSATERRNLKISLILIQIKRKASEKGRFRDKNLLLTKHCWSKHDYEF